MPSILYFRRTVLPHQTRGFSHCLSDLTREDRIMTFSPGTKSCPRCGAVFHQYHHAQKYCNPFCKPAKKGTSSSVNVQPETTQRKDGFNPSGQERMHNA